MMSTSKIAKIAATPLAAASLFLYGCNSNPKNSPISSPIPTNTPTLEFQVANAYKQLNGQQFDDAELNGLLISVQYIKNTKTGEIFEFKHIIGRIIGVDLEKGIIAYNPITQLESKGIEKYVNDQLIMPNMKADKVISAYLPASVSVGQSPINGGSDAKGIEATPFDAFEIFKGHDVDINSTFPINYRGINLFPGPQKARIKGYEFLDGMPGFKFSTIVDISAPQNKEKLQEYNSNPNRS